MISTPFGGLGPETKNHMQIQNYFQPIVCSWSKEEFQKMMMMTLPTYALLTTKSRII